VELGRDGSGYCSSHSYVAEKFLAALPGLGYPLPVSRRAFAFLRISASRDVKAKPRDSVLDGVADHSGGSF
jgi:hypothetical protein